MKNDRVGFGCDVNEDFITIARERITMLKDGTLKTRPMDKPIYDPLLPNGGHK
jgi:adenine-specific DNA-methyltransferase